MKLQLLGGWWAGVFWWGEVRGCMIRQFYERGELVVWMMVFGGVELRFFKPDKEEDVE